MDIKQYLESTFDREFYVSGGHIYSYIGLSEFDKILKARFPVDLWGHFDLEGILLLIHDYHCNDIKEYFERSWRRPELKQDVSLVPSELMKMRSYIELRLHYRFNVQIKESRYQDNGLVIVIDPQKESPFSIMIPLKFREFTRCTYNQKGHRFWISETIVTPLLQWLRDPLPFPKPHYRMNGYMFRFWFERKYSLYPRMDKISDPILKGKLKLNHKGLFMSAVNPELLYQEIWNRKYNVK